MSAPGADHERERILVVAALAGVLAESWPVREGLAGLGWGWTLRRVGELELGARLWSELVRAGADRDLSAAARAELERDAHETAALSALRAEAARRAGAALDDAGVPWMPMKGAALTLLAPEYGATRRALDVDLVVPPDDLERAGGALAASHRLVGEQRDYDGAQRDADAAMRDGVQHLYTFEGVGGVTLELHHAFPGLPRREVTAAIFSRATVVAERGRSVRVPALDDLLGTLCVHAVIHHAGDRKLALRHLADVSELLARGASPEVARGRFDRWGGSSVAESMRALELAREEARTRGASPGAAGRAVEVSADDRVRAWGSRLRLRGARIVAGLRRSGLAAVLPPRRFMVALYGARANGIRLPLLHLHRWGAIVLRAISGK